jgi:hypothetical protein
MHVIRLISRIWSPFGDADPHRTRTTDVFCQLPFFLRNLVIPKGRAPGTTPEQERLHERSFSLDRVHHIVSGPCVKHLCQGDFAQLGMPGRPSEIAILDVLEQSKTLLTFVCERCHEVRGRRFRSLGDGTVRIEIVKVLPCQKSAAAGRKEVFRVS